MDCMERVTEFLHKHEVPFTAHSHSPAGFRAEVVAALESVPGSSFAKVVMVIADDRIVMTVVPADHWVDLAEVQKATGAAEVMLAHEDEFAGIFPDCEVGAMPPLGTIYGVPTYIDPALQSAGTVFFQAGTHTQTISLAYDDLVRVSEATVAPLSHPRREAG